MRFMPKKVSTFFKNVLTAKSDFLGARADLLHD